MAENNLTLCTAVPPRAQYKHSCASGDLETDRGGNNWGAPLLLLVVGDADAAWSIVVRCREESGRLGGKIFDI